MKSVLDLIIEDKNISGDFKKALWLQSYENLGKGEN